MNRIEINDLRIGVGEKELVNGISFHAQEDESLAIIGESGSGKSLTALAVMGLLDERYTVEGQILFDGVDLTKLSEKKRKAYALKRIAMIYQNPFRAFSPVERIERQVRRIFAIQNKKLDLAQVKELLSYTKLNPDYILKKYPFEMSGGELQRTLIALSMLFEPELLLCDEPTTALDASTGKQILGMIKALQMDKKITVVFISHDLSYVDKLADRILIMKKGKIVEEGRKEEIFEHPKEEYTKLLMKASRLER